MTLIATIDVIERKTKKKFYAIKQRISYSSDEMISSIHHSFNKIRLFVAFATPSRRREVVVQPKHHLLTESIL